MRLEGSEIMAFRDNLIRLRQNAGYSQAKEFAKAANIPYTTYVTYENINPKTGKSSWPNEDNLIKIASTLHVSVDSLLGYNYKAPDKLQNAINDFEKCGFTIYESGLPDMLSVSFHKDKSEDIPKVTFKKPLNAANYQENKMALFFYTFFTNNFLVKKDDFINIYEKLPNTQDYINKMSSLYLQSLNELEDSPIKYIEEIAPKNFTNTTFFQHLKKLDMFLLPSEDLENILHEILIEESKDKDQKK